MPVFVVWAVRLVPDDRDGDVRVGLADQRDLAVGGLEAVRRGLTIHLGKAEARLDRRNRVQREREVRRGRAPDRVHRGEVNRVQTVLAAVQGERRLEMESAGGRVERHRPAVLRHRPAPEAWRWSNRMTQGFRRWPD